MIKSSNYTEKRVLIFEGIDDWNRPVFKDNLNNRFGNTEILFDWDATEEDVLAAVLEHDAIQYKARGTSFEKEIKKCIEKAKYYI